MATSSYQWHGSSNQPMSSGSINRAKRMASCGLQPRFASTTSLKSGPAALRATSTRLKSSSGARPPTLNLQPAIPAARYCSISLPIVGELLALHVVAADGDDGEPFAVGPEQRRDVLAERLPDEVPQRAIHARYRLHQGLAIAVGMGQLEHRLPGALDLQELQPLYPRRQLLLDQARDGGRVLAVVPVVDLAHEAVAGPEARHDGRALQHRVRAAAEVLRERDVDGESFDALYFHGRDSVISDWTR